MLQKGERLSFVIVLHCFEQLIDLALYSLLVLHLLPIQEMPQPLNQECLHE
jgi:hypothetical protein